MDNKETCILSPDVSYFAVVKEEGKSRRVNEAVKGRSSQ